MKAAIVQSPGHIEVKEVLEPILGDYDVLCEILACSVCSGTDKNIVFNHPYHKVTYPTILGHEAIGKVIQCGSKVKNFHPGDLITRIFNKLSKNSPYTLRYGAFAEKGIATDWIAMRDDGIPSEQWKPFTIHRVLPPNFDPIESTMIITWRETYAFFKTLNLSHSSHILILGSGANALAFVDHSRNAGINSLTVVGNENRSSKFIKSGAKEFISHTANIHDILKQKNLSFDCIIDAIGKDETLNQIISHLKSNGKIALYGLESYLTYTIEKSKAPQDFMFFDGTEYDEGSVHDEIINFIQQGKLNAWDYFSKEHIYPLSDIEKALQATWNRKVMKSVVIMNEITSPKKH